MRKLIFYIIISSLLISACKDESKTDSLIDQDKKTVLRINESEICKSIFPPSTNDIVSSQIISQIFEGLVKYEPKTLSIIPAIAKNWKIEEDGMKYTFYLRDDVYFHDDNCFKDGKGRKLTANDVKYSFELLCTKSDDNFNFYGTLDKIKGAKEFYEKTTESNITDIDGIKIIDDLTIELYLESANPLFIYFLANPAAVIIPKEGYEAYGINNHVGSGPFSIKLFEKDIETLELVKNQNYYRFDKDSVRLPYLDSVIISFHGSVQKELKMFEDGKLDFVAGLPSKFIPDFLENHIKEFESDPPLYILNQSEEDVASEVYNLSRSYVHDFFTNRMNYFDLSLVYIEELKSSKPIGTTEKK